MNTFTRYAGVMVLLATACTPRRSATGTNEQLKSSVSSVSSIGRTFTNKREVFDHYETQGFLIHGSFENGKWPATVVYEKEAPNEVHFVLKNGQTHGYPGSDGYRMKVVALEDESGGEIMLVFRSREKEKVPNKPTEATWCPRRGHQAPHRQR